MQEDSIVIKVAKVIKGANCTVSYTCKVGERTDTVDGRAITTPVHPDLLNAFKKLVPHCIAILEFSKLGQGNIMDSLSEFHDGIKEDLKEAILKEREDYTVTGYTISNEESVILHASRKLSTGKVFNCNTPLTNFEGSYEGGSQLEEAIAECSKEVIEYMGGKSGQVKMELSDTAVAENGEIKSPESRNDAPVPGKKVQDKSFRAPAKPKVDATKGKGNSKPSVAKDVFDDQGPLASGATPVKQNPFKKTA